MEWLQWEKNCPQLIHKVIHTNYASKYNHLKKLSTSRILDNLETPKTKEYKLTERSVLVLSGQKNLS